MMNRFICTALLATMLPAFTGIESLPLVAPLEKSVGGYSAGIWSSPKLNLDLSKTNQPLLAALNALDRTDAPPTYDEIDLVVSALKAANEDKALQPYLESQMGYSVEQVRAWLKQNAPPSLLKRESKRAHDTVDKIKRTTIGLGVAGLGAGTGLMAIPLAFTVVGLIPAVILAGVSAQMMAAGAQIIAGPQNAPVIEKAMPDLMVAMIGGPAAQPDAHLPWRTASEAPTEELIKRLRHASLLQKAVEGLGTTELQKLNENETNLVSTAQQLYARDVVLVQMMLSVLSRQVDQGQHLDQIANLLGALPADQGAALMLAARAMADAPTPFLGLANYVSPELTAQRQREVTHFGRWVEVASLARAANPELGGAALSRRVADLLGEDATFKRFNAGLAAATLERIRQDLPVASPSRRERLKKAFQRWKN